MSIGNYIFFWTPLFLLVWLLIICFGMYFFYTYKKRENFTEDELLKKIFSTSNFWYRLYVWICVSISVCVFLYLSWPYTKDSYTTVKKNGIDIEIVLDLSYSMIATDITPSRIEVAKKVFGDFIWELQTDRVWLVLFSWKPFTSVPLTYDYDFLNDYVRNISIETIDQRNPRLQWTAIGDALVLASDTLVSDEEAWEREKVIILITDGEANRGVEPLLALKLLKKENIKTYAIGVWKDDITIIQAEVAPWIYQNIEIGWIDEEILQKISDETWWEYFRADSESSLRGILDRIQELEKKEIEIEVRNTSESLRVYLSGILFLLLIGLLYCIFIKRIRHV